MSAPKIVRKKGEFGQVYAFWLGETLRPLYCCQELSHLDSPEYKAERGDGRLVTDISGPYCGTTLDAIRAELLALETPPADAPLTPSEREELSKLQRFAGWSMVAHTFGLDGSDIQEKATELGLMAAVPCDQTCEDCCGAVPGEDTCYRPRYDEDGTPIGEVGG